MIDIEALADSGELFDKYYLLLRPINTEGGTADVWLALDVRTVKDKKILKEAPLLEEDYLATKGLLVAIKVYRPKNALDIEGETKFLDEFAIVYNCRHSNLITPTSFSIFEEIPYLVLPYCKKGSSELFLGNMTSNDDIWKYISDVASGLAYLHHCNPPIIHQDIKPANVLIDDFNNYAITDFGISEKYDSQDEENNDDEEKSGTSAYMSPERFDPESEPSEAGDIWAFGATLYELITGNVPFGEEGGSVQGDGKISLNFPKGISPDIQRLIYACLDKSPEKRPSAETIIKTARIKHYPLKRIPLAKMIACLAVLIIIAIVGGGVFYYNKMQTNDDKRNHDQQPIEQGTISKDTGMSMYEQAITCLKSTQKDSLIAGIDKLKDLAKEKNTMAIYELAYTYGWVPEEESLRRKKILGIELGNPKGESQSAFMPKSEDVNKEAIGYFQLVTEQQIDNAHADIKMKSFYRLGCYYRAAGNKEKAISHFTKAEEEAKKIGDIKYSKSSEEQIAYCKNNL